MSPRWGLDTKTYWLTGRQSQCDFELDLNWQLLLASRYIDCSRTSRKTRPLPSNGYMRTIQKTLLPLLLYFQRHCIETEVIWLLPAYSLFSESLPSKKSTCHNILKCNRMNQKSVQQRARGWIARVRFPAGTRFFSFLQRPDWFWGSPSLLSNGHRRNFPHK
jgi:hypothetical protein